MNSRILLFVRRLQKLRRLPAMAEVVASEVKTLRATYNSTSLPGVLCDYRRAIKERLGDEHPAAAMLLSEPNAARAGVKPAHRLGLSLAEVSRNKQRDRYRVAQHQYTQTPVSDPGAMVAKALALIQHPGAFAAGPRVGLPRWDKMLVGLALITGRRPVELGFYGDFLPLPKPCPPLAGRKLAHGWLMFEGQAKTREADGTRQEAYPIPLLASSETVLQGFQSLRRWMPPFASAEQFSATASTRMAETMLREFGGSLRAYDLRAIYALLTWHRYARPAQALTSWIGEVLGHKLLTNPEAPNPGAVIADTATAAFYNRFYLPESAKTAWRKAGAAGLRRE